MKYLLLLIPFCSMAQKPVIDSAAINHWISPGNDYDLAITHDGKCFAYVINNQPIHSRTVVVLSTTNSWKQAFPDASPGFFSSDNRQYVFMIKDTLCFFDIATQQYRIINGVTDLKHRDEKWVSWKNADVLVVHNILTGWEKRYPEVKDYSFDKNGKTLLLKTSTGLDLVSLPSGEIKPISNDTLISNYTLDNSGTQAVFMQQGVLWYYKMGMDKAIVKVNDHTAGVPSGLHIGGVPYFSDNDHYIFFELQQPNIPKKPGAISLDVWSYKDTILQSTQLYRLQPKAFTAVIAIDHNQVIQVQRDDETLKLLPGGDFMIFGKNTMGDRFWLNQPDSNWLISLKDGSRKLLQIRDRGFEFRFSPDNSHLVYFDPEQQYHYFSYDLRTGKVTNISPTIPPGNLAVIDEYKHPLMRHNFPVGIAAWLDNGRDILVYDNYDIWRLDITGSKPPVNITNGYGRLHHIKFRLTNEVETKNVPDTPLLLSAYNTLNKQNGFYRTTKKNPELLTMGPYVLDLCGPNIYALNNHDFDRGIHPIKARDTAVWIVKKQSATSAPNYFITSDFKNYIALTNLQHQEKYNWLTTELVSFKQLDGSISQGVLYKPENFNPHKKYPVLFNYYEQMSHRLYQYPVPSYTTDNINVAWFVSHGYLVFTPDIHFNNNLMGKSACNTIAGAAIHLSKLPYVDGKRLGLNGHSVGGFLTNYIITHTNLFAAAIEGAGTTDVISSALQLTRAGFEECSRLDQSEMRHGPLWDNEQEWLSESPIMKANKINTPLIIFHGKIDDAVPWEQAVELFISLRRLGKKVWILQYDEANHAVGGKDAEDYTIRITQFFNHYLKGEPAPVWMTRGIPARMKGVVDGLEPDTEIKTP